jgi:DNA polymerase III epsilon subunit-like protein
VPPLPPSDPTDPADPPDATPDASRDTSTPPPVVPPPADASATGEAGPTPANGPATAPSSRRGAARFVFVDTEATGLDHSRHELTEVAWVVRFEDGREVERRFFPEHTTDGADADALELTHYEERIAPQDKTPASEWLTTFLEDAQGAVLVGAVPDFDARHLDRMCRKLGLEPTWDHHLLDVETLALPLIAPGPEVPRSLAKTCAALGIPHDKDQAHGALYDAQQAMRVFDRVWELLADLRRTGAPLPAPVPRNGNGRDRGAKVGAGSDPAPAATGADTDLPAEADAASDHARPRTGSDPDPSTGGAPPGQPPSGSARSTT